MQELSLRAIPGAWQKFTARKNNRRFQRFSETVHERDNYTCQFCGFHSKDFQEVVNLDLNYQNNKLSNMATSCIFCCQCFFLEAVGMGDFGGGKLIFLPEMTQAELNSFCHVLFCAIANETTYKEHASDLYKTFKMRSQMLDDEFGEGFSEPSLFGRMLVENNISIDKQADILEKIRLLPNRDRFKKQIDHWAKASMREMFLEVYSAHQ